MAKSFTICFLLAVKVLAQESQYDTLTLQIFPEMHKYRIQQIAPLSADYVIAAHAAGLLKWDGRAWSEFHPPPPVQQVNDPRVFVFSQDNIYLFFRPAEHIYHTRMLHYNGGRWRYLPSPQAYKLTCFSFLDGQRFFAGGHNGSLIYFDGQTSRNIPTPPCNEIFYIKAFDEQHLLLIVEKLNSEYENGAFVWSGILELVEQHNGNWRVIQSINKYGDKAYFYTPDSGVIYYNGGRISELPRDEMMQKDLLKMEGLGTAGKPIRYFYDGKKLYRYEHFTLTPLVKMRNVDLAIASFSPISANEFFFLDTDRHLYYLGRRKLAEPLRANRLKFSYSILANDENADVFGKSLYRNKHGGTDIYLTVSTRTNQFLSRPPGGIGDAFSDEIAVRGLEGYRKEVQNVAMFDSGVFFADIDNDGDMDAVLTAFKGKSQLYENIGSDRFRNVTGDYGFKLVGRIPHIAWGDINNDGFLDFAAGDGYGPLRIYYGDGHFNFYPILFPTVTPDLLTAYMPWLADLDNDGDLDVVAHSLFGPVKVFENTGISGERQYAEFADRSDRSPALTRPFDYFTQSIAIGDYDNDGDLDLYLANRRSPMKLFRNEGNFRFTDVSDTAGFGQRAFAYGGNWGDLNQDGWLDLFVANLGRNYIFWNRRGRYFEIDSLCLPNNFEDYSAGAVLADMNNDGSLDIVVANSYIGNSAIYYNRINRCQPLIVEVIGTQSNRFGIGARIWVYDAGHGGDVNYLRGFRQITTLEGYIGSGLPEAYFYLPDTQKYDLVAALPSGEKIERWNISPGQRLILKAPHTAETRLMALKNTVVSLFRHPGRRPFTIRFAILGSVFIAINFLLWRRSLWRLQRIAFFNLALCSVLLASWFLIDWIRHFIPVLWIFSAAGAIFFAAIHYDLYRERRAADPLPLYELLRQFTHGKTGMQQIDKMLFIGNNLDPATPQKLHESARREAQIFQRDTVPLLQQVVQTSRDAAVPAKIVQHLQQCVNVSARRSRKLYLDGRTPSVKAQMRFVERLKAMKACLTQMQQEVEKLIATPLLETVQGALYRFPEYSRTVLQSAAGVDQIRVNIPRNLLADILSNLFQNSVEAMRGQSRREIRVAIDFLNKNVIQLVICDSGPGIPEHLRERIFEDGFSTKGSTGLGLYHVRTFLERFGGGIELAESRPGEGACFKLKLRLIHGKR